MATSDAGLRFIENEEEGPVTHRLHCPKGGSGVTLGPGYNMRYKSASEIVHDLMLINVSRSTAMAVSAASGLHGSAASDFCDKNKYTVDLSKAQQAALLGVTVGKYEAMIQDGVTVPLYRHEFDALVSFAYNPGHALPNVLHAIDSGRVPEAMNFIAAVDTSGGVVMDGLRKRRRREIALYLYGKYMIRASVLAVLAMAISAAGARASPGAFAPRKDMIDTMRGDIVGKAMFDGQAITDVQQPSPCETVFTTAAGRIPIDWAHVPSPGYSRIDGRTDVELQHDDTIGHFVSPLPVAEVRLPFTLLYGSCQPQ